MTVQDTIESVSVATVDGRLPAPVSFGDWVMNSREFAIVRLRSRLGHEGWAFTLTRDGAVAEHIHKTLAAVYKGQPVGDQERLFALAQRRSLASHVAGIGLRALSLMDLAAWDLEAKSADRSIADHLGGINKPMPATAIIGYPPAAMGPAALGEQTTALHAAGWRRFKAPIAAEAEATILRMRAARAAAPGSWLGLDGAWVFNDVESASDLARRLHDVDLGWFEDVVPPGDAQLVRRLRDSVDVPIAMGDEQGGSYYPEALLAADAVDVVRIDLTCMGGITGGRRIVQQCIDAGVAFSPHMFAHVHSQVFSAWGHDDVPIEWGVPWTGVDPYADSLAQPQILADGRMTPLEEGPGFGTLINVEWAAAQPHNDPDGILCR